MIRQKQIANVSALVVTSNLIVQVVAGEILAPAYLFATNNVAAGDSSTQSDRILIADGSAVHAYGGGVWTLPETYLVQPWRLNFSLHEGTLRWGTGKDAGSYTAPSTLPETVLKKALLWVDATDADHLLGGDDGISAWYDRREIDTSAPQFCRASAFMSYTVEKPTLTVHADGAKAIYFGGLGSGVAFEWLLPSGTRYAGNTKNDRVVEVFAVNAISNSYGTIFSSFGYQPAYQRDTTHADSVSGFYWVSDSINCSTQNGKTYLDGERIDGSMTVVKTGQHLLEASTQFAKNCRTSGFFGMSSKANSGGDYLSEAIVFTNKLTEAERLIVEEYLMAKWMPAKTKRPLSMEVDSGATFEVDAVDGDVAFDRLSLTGEGALKKCGNGNLLVENRSGQAFDGEADIQGGKIVARTPFAVKVDSGKIYTATNDETGPALSVSVGVDGALEKRGTDTLVVRSVPGSTKKVRVRGGTFAVSPLVRDAEGSVSAYEVPIPNNGFEDFALEIAKTRPPGDGAMHLTVDYCGGWRSATWRNTPVMDWEAWTATSAALDNQTRSVWALGHPPEGTCALILRPSYSADATVLSGMITLPETGAYELEFRYAGREAEGYMAMAAESSLVAEGTAKSYVFGTNVQTVISGYVHTKMRLENVPAGNYTLRFVGLRGGVIGIPSASKMGMFVIDDIHLYKCPDDPRFADTWRIPGGDFETTVGNQLQCIYVDAQHQHPNWTFVQPPDCVDDKIGKVGLVSAYASQDTSNLSGCGPGAYFNNSREPNAGSFELLFTGNGAEARNTFTPPAGTWFLKLDAARLGSYGCFPKLTATVEIGGVTTSLGMIAPKSRLMLPTTIETPFTVDGATPITLRFVASDVVDGGLSYATGVFIDDLRLVKYVDFELFKDGDFESNSHLWRSFNSASAGGASRIGNVQVRYATESVAAFGPETADGVRMVSLENLSGVYEDVSLPLAGRYRLSFYEHSRLTGKGGYYGPNPVRVWVAKGGVTNVIGRADTYNSEWVLRSYDFEVDAPGTYRVCIQGTMNPDDARYRREALVDAVSLRQVGLVTDVTPPFPCGCSIRIDEGARLETQFRGTNVVSGLRLGGMPLHGVVKASDYPDYLSGPGFFEIVPTNGLLLLFR